MATVCLIAPGSRGTLEGNPTALLSLALFARRYGHEAKVISRLDQASGSQYLGISVTSATYQSGLAIAAKAKEMTPTIETILGGPHTLSQGSIILSMHPEIDYVVEGQGERALTEILNGTPQRHFQGSPLTQTELGSMPLSAMKAVDSGYFQTMRQFGRLNYCGSRGCPFSCSFCASNGRLTSKSVNAYLDDLQTLSSYDRHISIQDNYFGVDAQRTKELCQGMIERRLDLDWDCQTRIESVQDQQLLSIMRTAGCTAAYLGIENFHLPALKAMNKTARPTEYLRLTQQGIRNLLIAGITPSINLQIGLPGENYPMQNTNVSALETLGQMASGRPMNIFVHLAVTYPGTADYARLISNGVPMDIFEYYTHWEAEQGQQIGNLIAVNHLVHGAGGIPVGLLELDAMRKGEFVIDSTALHNIADYVSRLRSIQGIRVYAG